MTEIPKTRNWLDQAIVELFKTAQQPDALPQVEDLLIASAHHQALSNIADLLGNDGRIRSAITDADAKHVAALLVVDEALKVAEQAETDDSLATTEPEQKRTRAALKKANEVLQRAREDATAIDRRVTALHRALQPIAAEIEQLKPQMSTMIAQHGADMAKLVAAELREAVVRLAPLLQLARALATGSQSRGLQDFLHNLEIVEPGTASSVLRGTKFNDSSDPVAVAGTGIMVPSSADLADGWADDPALRVITAAARTPIEVARRVTAYMPLLPRGAAPKPDPFKTAPGYRSTATGARQPSTPAAERADPMAASSIKPAADASGRFSSNGNSPRTRPGRMVNGRLTFVDEQQAEPATQADESARR